MSLSPFRAKYLLLLLIAVASFATPGCSESTSTDTKKQSQLWGDAPFQKPSCIKGVHLTCWFAGNKKGRAHIEDLLAETELNTVAIAVKEIQGDFYLPGVKVEGSSKAYVAAIPDLKEYLHYLKEHGVWTIARVVVFKDQRLPKEHPEWAIKSSTPLALAQEKGFARDVWVDHKGLAWADPTNQHVWDYNIAVAERALELGFQEIQFDYIRFPSDGPVKYCVYSKPHNRAEAPKFLAQFLHRAHEKLKPEGALISIDVFGLVGSTGDDMGIGQKLVELLGDIDAVSPMMYPSHYAMGELGIKNPNKSPYDTVFSTIRDTQRLMGNKPVSLRPYLQDFSLGVKYTPRMVRDQIQAAMDLGVNEWLLWSPSCRYTKEALEPFVKPEDRRATPTPVEEPSPAKP